jgi:predicted ATPase
LNADSNTAPTDIILTNNTIPENAPNGTVVGDLIAVDAEGNNTQNFTLLDSAGDRFQIFGNLLTVANDELLDFESSTSHSITVRTTDSIGDFFEEQFAINITNVPEEASASIPTPVSTPTAIGETDPGGIVPILTASDIFAGF